MKRLQDSRVAVFGVGGVGGHAIEALVRSGVGSIDIIDNDSVSITNLNRQIIALHSTIGMKKVDAMAQRIHDINPNCRVNAVCMFFDDDTKDCFDFDNYDYVVDAIDSVRSKLLLAEICYKKGIKIISSMGAGNKLDPTAFEITDISKTSYDPLARAMRSELKKRGIMKLPVVYSKEQPIKPRISTKDNHAPASNAFVPSAVGMIIASRVIKDLTEI